MADDDNFDIDIYGDDSTQDYNDGMANHADVAHDHSTGATLAGDAYEENQDAGEPMPQETHDADKQEDVTFTDGPSVDNTDGERQQISSTGGSAHDQVQAPKQAPVQQGVKRKEGPDDRPTDPGATAAIQIQDLHWWICEDDIRGWANQAGCEDELKDVTFNEHKVNGKSKGQVFIEMLSPQAATALKHRVESFGSGTSHSKKYNVTYHIAEINPFRTHPKEVPNRKDRDNSQRNTSNYNNNQSNYNQHGSYGGMQNNYRGRGSYNQNRGNMGYSNQRNFSGPPNMGMGNQGFGGPMGGFNNNMGGGMNMGMGGMNYNNNFNRGGGMMGGMRGGMMNNRGRGGNMMGGMGMNMGNMGGMGMNGMMGGGMQGNFGNTPHFNPAFFNQNQQGGGGDWNSQHPAKRQRAE